jgi:hypothetical protein
LVTEARGICNPGPARPKGCRAVADLDTALKAGNLVRGLEEAPTRLVGTHDPRDSLAAHMKTVAAQPLMHPL